VAGDVVRKNGSERSPYLAVFLPGWKLLRDESGIGIKNGIVRYVQRA
jgi:hypothetical protein